MIKMRPTCLVNEHAKLAETTTLVSLYVDERLGDDKVEEYGNKRTLYVMFDTELPVASDFILIRKA